MKNNLSVVILTKNEEENIVDCLESVAFAEEIIIVDDNSTDRTIDLAKRFTDKLFIHSINGNFASQRNYALNLAHNSWVLFVDADERVSEKLRDEILKSIQKKGIQGFKIRRIDNIWNQKIEHGEGGSIELLRLARKDSGKWKGKVHETWKITGNCQVLSNALIHIPHASVSKFIKDIDEYSEIRAIELHETKTKSNAFYIIFYPASKFFINYFIKKGYRDGIPGFLYAMIMSMHSFLVRAKLYLLNNSTH